MIFEIKEKFKKYETVEKSHFRDLTKDEKKGAAFNLSDYLSFISSYRHNTLNYTELNPQSMSEKFVGCIKNFSDEAKNIIRLIIKESVDPRSTQDTTDWGNNVIKAIPFVISETVEELKEAMFSLHRENKFVQYFNFVTPKAKQESQNIVDETESFLASFIPMFKHIHPSISIEYNIEDTHEKVEEYFKNIQSKNLQLNYDGLHKAMSHLHEQDMELDERGMREEACSYSSTPEKDDTMQTLYELIEFKAYRLNTILSIFMATMVYNFYKNRNNQLFFNRFKNFESYNTYSRLQLLEHCSRGLYDVKSKTEKEMKEFEQDTDKRKIKYDYKINHDKINALKFTSKFYDWIQAFNQLFNAEKTTNRTFNIASISDCHVVNVDNTNLVAIPLINPENGYIEQYRGALMNNEQLEKALQKEISLSDTLLKDWDILGENENQIMSTSFHNLNHIIEELNNKEIVKFFFKEKPVEEEWIFMS